MRTSRLASLLASVLLALVQLASTACGVDPAPDPAPAPVSLTEARSSAAPLLGTEGSSDAADNGCGVVLRQIGRAAGNYGGYATACGTSGCFYVWEGTLDVSEAWVSAGATAHVLFQSSAGAAEWWEVDATAVEGAGAGYQRYAFRLTDHTVTDGMSTTSLNRTHIELVPFLRDAEGTRWFDHNRHPNPFENYVMVVDNGWSVQDDGATCQPAHDADWMGNVAARISRESGAACDGAVAMGD